MALTKSLTKKRRGRAPGARRNQFGVTLADAPAEMLRAAARRRRIYPTTLAAELLEQALLEQQTGGGRAKELAELREAIRTLALNQRNGLRKLLLLGGMPAKEVEEWITRRLKK